MFPVHLEEEEEQYMLTLLTNIDLLVVGSVFELNEACDNGGAFLIDEVYTGKVKVGWINNNELLFGNK